MNKLDFNDEDPLCDFDLNTIDLDTLKTKFMEER